MTGILPNGSNGALVYQTQAGVCVPPPNVTNTYCVPNGFTLGCDLTALPNDCTAVIHPSQINAIVSELIALAAAVNPTGVWNCGSNGNLAANISAVLENSGVANGIEIKGTGTIGDPYYIDVVPLITKICSSAKSTLVNCIISTDANNDIIVGTDGGAYLNSLSGSTVSVAPATTNLPAIPTTHFGTNTIYLSAPTRWVSFTLPGVPGIVTIPSYS